MLRKVLRFVPSVPPSTSSLPPPHPSWRLALRRGLAAGGAALLLLVIAAGPARVAGAQKVTGGIAPRLLWIFAGLLRDLGAVILLLAPAVLFFAALLPLTVTRLRRGGWQRAGAVLVAVPLALAVWVFGITAHEFKSERGSYPTVFDLAEGASSTSFLRGTFGFLRYDRYWIPALVFGLAGLALVVACVRRPRRLGAAASARVLAWQPWLSGMALSLAMGTLVARVFVASTASPQGRFSASAVGDPFRSIMESAFDLIVHRGKATPRELVRDVELPDALVAEGAALVGWPPRRASGAGGAACAAHPHARPLDRAQEPPIADARGEELVRAFEQVGAALFSPGDRRVVVWQLALESFRADDIHALNPQAPRETTPFVNGLYEAAARGGEGVLASRATYQAGVRTAQGLGALTCGLGTLPYNLSAIRDLHPLPLRCTSDVLADAGFRGSFFYGSDATFDGMSEFLRAHGYAEQVSEAELPKELPKGAWGAVTDAALVDEATSRTAKSLEVDPGPRFAMIMSLSNHSPYTLPADLPVEVRERVVQVLATTSHHAVSDDHARIMTHAYTDAAIARFFQRLEALHLAERSIVVLSADHSTGETYVWGPDTHGPDSDDAKTRIPFAVVLPPALLAHARDRAALDAALRSAQRAVDAGPLSQNDIPALLLALVRSHAAVQALPPEARWHTLGGQITSPWFEPPARDAAYVFGINGVSELYTLDRAGVRRGPYEESVFLKTRGDRYSVTPTLVPVTATLSSLMRAPLAPPAPCAGSRAGSDSGARP